MYYFDFEDVEIRLEHKSIDNNLVCDVDRCKKISIFVRGDCSIFISCTDELRDERISETVYATKFIKCSSVTGTMDNQIANHRFIIQIE